MHEPLYTHNFAACYSVQACTIAAYRVISRGSASLGHCLLSRGRAKSEAKCESESFPPSSKLQPGQARPGGPPGHTRQNPSLDPAEDIVVLPLGVPKPEAYSKPAVGLGVLRAPRASRAAAVAPSRSSQNSMKFSVLS